MANIFLVFLTFFETFAEALAEGNVQRKLEKREKYAIFLSDWTITCLSSMHKIYERNKLNSRSQQQLQQKGAMKKE